MDRYCFDADLDPDTAPSFTHVGESELLFTFTHSSVNLHCFIFHVSVIDVIYFLLLESIFILKRSGKQNSLVFPYICLKYTWIRIRIHLPEGLQIFFFRGSKY